MYMVGFNFWSAILRIVNFHEFLMHSPTTIPIFEAFQTHTSSPINEHQYPFSAYKALLDYRLQLPNKS